MSKWVWLGIFAVVAWMFLGNKTQAAQQVTNNVR